MPRNRLVTLATALALMSAAYAQQPEEPEKAGQNLGRSLPLPQQPGESSAAMAKWSTTRFPGRVVFLNGVNIGSVRNQRLKNVDVFIDENGNLQITAPHYDVREESSYHPLLPSELPRFSKTVPAPPPPVAQATTPVPAATSTPPAAPPPAPPTADAPPAIDAPAAEPPKP